MKILILLLILVPFLGGLGILIKPIEDTHRRNAYVLSLCSVVSAAAIGMLLFCLLAKPETGFAFARIFGENFTLRCMWTD